MALTISDQKNAWTALLQSCNFVTELHSAMLNERSIEPFQAHNAWLTEGVIAPLSLMSTMS
jgi:hypothetical protein